MATMTDAFRNFVNQANENLALITDPAEKAKICAQLALALATTGHVKEIKKDEDTLTEKTTTKKEKSGKESLKKENKVVPPTEEEKEEVAEEVKNETEAPQEEGERDVTINDTWEDEYWTAKFKDEVDYLQKSIEEYGEEQLNEAVELFSQGNYKSIEDIQPFNIVAFVTYLKELTEEE